jgi:F-type H+-transporting ATPase subunit b
MDQILSTLGELLLKAVPTVILFIFLYLFLKSMLFNPLDKVLAERDSKTAGARDSASKSLKRADEKAAALETALRNAKGELYKEQETTRRQWLDDQAEQLKGARSEAEDMIERAKSDLAVETESAKASLASQSEALADHIAKSLLENRAS